MSGECHHGVSRGGVKEWNDGRGEFSDSVLPSFIPLRRLPVCVAVFLFAREVLTLFVRNSSSKKKL